MAETSRLTLRRAPRQARSRGTYNAIPEAATRLLMQDGPDTLTTNVIAEHAGVSIGSLYQFFPGKEAILATLVREMRVRMLDDMRAAAQAAKDAPLHDRIVALVQASLHHHVQAPELTNLLEQIEDHLPMNEESVALKKLMFDIVSAVLQAEGVARPEVTARDLIGMVHGMVQAAFKAGERDFDDLAHRLERATCGYLGA